MSLYNLSHKSSVNPAIQDNVFVDVLPLSPTQFMRANRFSLPGVFNVLLFGICVLFVLVWLFPLLYFLINKGNAYDTSLRLNFGD